MPHLVQFHDADRVNLVCLGTKTLYIVPKALNPAHHRCMRYACQTGNAPKPNALQIKTNALGTCFEWRSAQRGDGIITTAIFAFIALLAFDLAVFDADGTPTVGTGHPKAYNTTILMHQSQFFSSVFTKHIVSIFKFSPRKFSFYKHQTIARAYEALKASLSAR